MSLAFASSILSSLRFKSLNGLCPTQTRPKASRLCPYHPRACVTPDPNPNLYAVLGLSPNPPTPYNHTELRRAYLALAKTSHPDVSASSPATFDAIARAWAILGDPTLRRVYDTAGAAAIAAIRSIDERAAALKRSMPALDGEQLDFLSDTGQLTSGLLSSVEERLPGEDEGETTGTERDDACPRSVEEAVWNVQFHHDRSVKYYGLWWIYKFKVAEAEEALVNVLRTSREQTALGGFGLRRRAALALGAVAAVPTAKRQDTILALSEALRSPDYFLKYRAAEALANIAQRAALDPSVHACFPNKVVAQLTEMLRMGQSNLERKEAARSGYTKQEGLFDLENLDDSVRQRLEKIFEDRRQNEQRSRRTTMTPQLGVDEVGSQSDEPFEWVLKAVSAICSQHPIQDEALEDILRSYTKHSVPLVRYAAHKALYALTKQPYHAEEIVKALEYGAEHHYSQRVLIRDLGDLGYSQGAAAVARCPMVENSFKILALKNMIARKNHDAKSPEVRDVLAHMDSLL